MWTASTISNIGDGIVIAALPLLAVHLTQQPIAIAGVTIAARLPWLLVATFSGVLVDRSDRLHMMVATDVLRTVLFAAIAVLVATDQMSLTLLYVVVFIAGVLETLFDTAAMTITPSVVAAERLEVANARLDSAQSTANELVGPSLGGLTFAAVAFLPFGINAASFAVSVVLLLSIGGEYRSAPRSASFVDDAKEGFRFLWREPGIRAFAVGAGLLNLGQTAALSLLVLHSRENLQIDEAGFGLLLAAAAIGGILGSLGAPRIIVTLGRRTSVTAAVVAIAASLAVVGATTSAIVAGAGLALGTFAASTWNIVSVTHRQRATPDELLGRVMAGFRVIAYGAFPFGAALGGFVAGVLDVRDAFFVGAGVIAGLVPLLGVILPASALERGRPVGG